MPGIEVSSQPEQGRVSLNMDNKQSAIEMLHLLAEASELKTDANGMKTWDIGWQESFEGLSDAVRATWPDCTCDLLCKVHGKSTVGAPIDLSDWDSPEDSVYDWHPCLKQLVRCRIIFTDQQGKSRMVEATNSCSVGDAIVCPRVIAHSLSGEDYELCGPPLHAEQEAIKLLPEGLADGGIAYIYGHDWLCMDCQHALTAAGVDTFIITGEPA